MEVRAFAEQLIRATSLDEKRRPPSADLSDAHPGPALRIAAPGRPPSLRIGAKGRVRVPAPEGMHDPAQRVRILHALANHELQAAELFAWALLAFPDAPPAFRRGLLLVLADEQRHLDLYLDRLEAHGMHFGDLGLTGHFWTLVDDMSTPLEFVAAMGLTLENANLDFGLAYAANARAAGDETTAQAIEIVHHDEIRHVAFGWRWLRAFKGASESEWSAFEASLHPPLFPGRARGPSFDREARLQAGLTEEFIEQLAATVARKPDGTAR